MSADNWTSCPRCEDEANKDRDILLHEIEEKYGKIPMDEWDALRKGVETKRDPEETFREDYEFYGADEGEVVWHYTGQCSVCDLRVSTTGSKVFYP